MYVYVYTYLGFCGEGSAVVVAENEEQAEKLMDEFFREQGFVPEGEEDWHPDHPEVFNRTMTTKCKAAEDEQPRVLYVNYGGDGYR